MCHSTVLPETPLCIVTFAISFGFNLTLHALGKLYFNLAKSNMVDEDRFL